MPDRLFAASRVLTRTRATRIWEIPDAVASKQRSLAPRSTRFSVFNAISAWRCLHGIGPMLVQDDGPPRIKEEKSSQRLRLGVLAAARQERGSAGFYLFGTRGRNLILNVL